MSDLHEYKGATKNKLLLSVIITASVMVIEVIGSILTGSLALPATQDTRLHIYLLSCNHNCLQSTLPPSNLRLLPSEILAALFNSIFLFAVTGYIFYQGILRLLNPQRVLGFDMLLVALAG